LESLSDVIAVDTNIVVRLIVADDDAQVALALDLASRERLYVGMTVLLETEWVLRSTYHFDRASVCSALLNFGDLPFVQFEADQDIRWALARYAEAGELADYIHIATAREVGRFATFERRLNRRAGDAPPARIETLI
jgi:predicted nucleic-acid-binding protein